MIRTTMGLAAWLVIVSWTGTAMAAEKGQMDMAGRGLQSISRMHIELPENAGAALHNIAAVFRRQLERRAQVEFVDERPAWTVRVRIAENIGPEGFEIADLDGGVEVRGNDERGVLYGLGRLLQTSTFSDGAFVPSTWRGRSTPDCSLRSLYLATHFDNFFDVGPMAKNIAFIEESALRGINTILLVHDMYHFNDKDDPRAKAHVARLKELFKAINAIGIDAGLVIVSNGGYRNSPKELRAKRNRGYTRKDERVLCPSNPKGNRLIHSAHRELYKELKAYHVGHVAIWPYDDGGCNCEQCSPWGANGFLKVAEEGGAVARNVWPDCEISIGTWCFGKQEWEGLVKATTPRPEWLNYVIADSDRPHPQYKGKPALHESVPQVNFPRAAGIGKPVHGRYGANPKPNHYQKLWDKDGPRLDGGIVYLEGIYGDINAVIEAGFYWDKKTTARKTLETYISYEFSPDVVDDIMKAIEQMEYAQVHGWKKSLARDEDALALLRRANENLSPRAQKSWRWRILYCRAVLDSKTATQKEKQAARKELRNIYYCQETTHPGCRP